MPIGYENERPLPQAQEDVRILEFLYDKRLTLLNVRREHEWKIYFGAYAILGAADLAIFTNKVRISGFSLIPWALFCLSVFISCLGYEKDLQKRNRQDRTAINSIFNILCKKVGLLDSQVEAIREDPDADFKKLETGKNSYGWAFFWQMIMLTVFTIASVLLPLIKTKGEDFMKNWPWELIISIIGGGIITAIVGWLSTWSTNKRLKNTTHILAGLAEGLIKGHQVVVVRNKKGEPIGLNLAIAPEPEEVGVGENVIVLIKKADKNE